ncbi:DUF6932 family protein [Saccharibacillus sacchari]|uniref:DUF6932 family protein n=1 Tax=Saccharibacillus sacchari TaxID=456493 RepID=UPI000566DCE0|nr:hypothetical protein [Saccharibacillus sacchari]
MHFNESGLLQPNDYLLTMDQLRQSVLVQGPTDGSPWDSRWRGYLVDQLEIMVQQLWKVGIEDIFIDGSFVENKAHPSDIDGYFICDLMMLATGELQARLNKEDPYKVWTWDSSSRLYDRNSAKKQLPMWHRYRVELYPEYNQASGITDQYGHMLKFPSAFRQTRDTFLPKGIVKIVK